MVQDNNNYFTELRKNDYSTTTSQGKQTAARETYVTGAQIAAVLRKFRVAMRQTPTQNRMCQTSEDVLCVKRRNTRMVTQKDDNTEG